MAFNWGWKAGRWCKQVIDGCHYVDFERKDEEVGANKGQSGKRWRRRLARELLLLDLSWALLVLQMGFELRVLRLCSSK